MFDEQLAGCCVAREQQLKRREKAICMNYSIWHKVLIAKLVGTSGECVFKVYFYFLFAWLRIANDENDFWHKHKSDPDEHREQHLNLAKNIGNKKLKSYAIVQAHRAKTQKFCVYFFAFF